MTAWASVAGEFGDDFDDIKLLGRGGSGTVYRATQRSLGRTVAVKVFRRFADDETQRVLSEARAQAALSWHANVVSLYGHGVTSDGFPYLVMEYAPGGSLRDRVAKTGPLSEAQCRRAGAELASALEAAHRTGVVHCDVKPSNVLFAADGSVRLADFGIARAAETTEATIDSIEGSLAYLAPELLDGKRPSPANDVYSMALTLSFARSAKPPYPDGLTLAQMVAAVQSGTPDVDLDFGDGAASLILAEALAKSPAKRPTSAQVADTLRGVTDDAYAPIRVSDGAGRYRRILTGVSVVALIALIGVLIVRAPERQHVVGVADSSAPFDLCGEYAAYMNDRREIIQRVTAEIARSESPVKLLDQVFNSYPQQFAQATTPFLTQAAQELGVQGTISEAQMASMTIAQNIKLLDRTSKPFLSDGGSDDYDAIGLPYYLTEPARVFSEVNDRASKKCPSVRTDLSNDKLMLTAAILVQLSSPTVVNDFFEDPASYDILNSEVVILMATYGWKVFKQLLDGRGEWLMELLRRHEDIRQSLVVERPAVLLLILQEEPQLLSELRTPEWKEPLQAGLDQNPGSETTGLLADFGDEIAAIGLEVR